MKILIRFFYDLGASTALLLRSCRSCCDPRYLTEISNRSGIAVQWNGGLSEVASVMQGYMLLCCGVEPG